MSYNMGKKSESISFKCDIEFQNKLDEIAKFYDTDRSKLITSILMGFICSWIEQKENGHKASSE